MLVFRGSPQPHDWRFRRTSPATLSSLISIPTGRIIMVLNRNSRTLQFEHVESRVCPAVLVNVGSNGDLAVSGDTAGAVVITALDSDSYQVTENAAVIATVNGVSHGIRVDLG